MSGNVAFDVAIGLIFIYLLYSLYVTVVMEIVSSIFGLRARNLSYALKRMLMDEKRYPNPAARVGSRILTTVMRVTGNAINLENRGLYDHFFKQPSIKYLTSGGAGNKPSYLSAENISKGLIDAIKVDNPDASVLACVEEGLLRKLSDGSETKQHIQSLLDDANYDLVKFKILLENWYNDTMERASGWFKQTTQVVLFLIGFVIVVSFNVDTISIVRKLSRDDDARNQLVQMATNFVEKNEAGLQSVENAPVADSTAVKQIQTKLDSLQATQKMLQEEIMNTQTVMGSNWYVSDSIPYKLVSAQPATKEWVEIPYKLRSGQNAYVIVHRSVDRSIFAKSVKAETNGFLKLNTVRYKYSYVFTWEHFWGYLMTVLALSLGAPFWFDLLNKLVKLRSSKAIASDTDDRSRPSGLAMSNRGILNRVG